MQATKLSRDQVRHALGHFATGVTVVTTLDMTGAPVGTTASAVSSLSLDPPLLLVCLDRGSATLAALRDHRAFTVNVLASEQRPLSGHFAQQGPAARWDEISHHRGATGAPVLEGVLAAIECDLDQCLAGGDHEIVIGRLREVQLHLDTPDPLLHYRGTYAGLVEAASDPRLSGGREP